MNQTDLILLLGIPYVEGGEGPEGYNCWGFLRHVLLIYFGKELPRAPIGDEAACRSIYEEKARMGEWMQIEHPDHGDVCLLRGGSSPHVGIWLDFEGGGVLHCMEPSGVIWTPDRNLSRFGYARRTYYRIADARHPHQAGQSVSPAD